MNGFMRKKAIICDLDGTLCNVQHRLHHVQKEPKDKDSFHNDLKNDSLVVPVYKILRRFEYDTKIIFLSSRPEKSREETSRWLIDNGFLIYNTISSDFSLFLKDDDSLNGHEFKEKKLLELKEIYNIMFAIDDRKSHINVFRKNGIFTFDVGSDDENKDIFTGSL